MSISQIDRALLTDSWDYPNVASVFIKDASGEIAIEDESIINDLDHNPRNFLVAFEKLRAASRLIFEALGKGTVSDSEFRTAVKCFGRASIQLVPVAGNLILYVYDRIRIHCFIHPSLKASLGCSPCSIVGIAFDGKPVFTLPIDTYKAHFESPDAAIPALSGFHYGWIVMREQQIMQIRNRQPAETSLESAKSVERIFRLPYGQRG